METANVTKDKNRSIIETIEKQIPALRNHLIELAAKLKEIPDMSHLDEFIATELLDESVELIKTHLHMQEDVFSRIKLLFPDCKENSLAAIEQLLLDEKIHLEICDTAKNALLQFQMVDVNHEAARDVLKGCREKALRLADMAEIAELETIAEPYRLFLEIMDNPRADITPAQEQTIDDEFPRPLPRLLYNGQFFLKETIPSDKRVDEQDPEDSLQAEPEPVILPTKQLLPQESIKHNFLTKKKDTQFKARSFLSEIGNKNGQSKWSFYPPFGEEKRDLLFILGWCRLLSEEQISRYIISDASNTSAIMQPLINEGYLTEITCADDGNRYFCFSSKGIQMFKKVSSREIFNTESNKIPDLLTTAEFFETHQNIIPLLNGLNRCTLYLYYKYIPELSDEKGVDISTTLINRETAKYNIPYAELSIFVPISNEKRSYVLVAAIPKNESEAEDLKASLLDTDSDAYIYIGDENTKSFDGGTIGGSLIHESCSYLAHFDQEEEVLIFTDAEGNCHTVASVLTDELMHIAVDQTNDARDTVISSKLPGEDNPETNIQPKKAPLLVAEPTSAEPQEHRKEDKPDTSITKGAVPYQDAVQELISTPKTAREMASKYLKEGINPSNTAEFMSLLDMLLAEGLDVVEDDIVENSFAQALLLSKALSFEKEYPEYLKYFNRLLLATDSTIGERIYSGDNILIVFGESNEFSSMHLATMLRALFAPDRAYDYNLRTHAEALFKDYDTYFQEYPMVKQLYNLLLQINDQSASGFTDAVLEQFSNHESRNEYFKQLQETAQRLCIEPIIKTKMSGMPKMITKCFGSESDIGICMEFISRNDREDREFVQITYNIFCEPVLQGEYQLSQSKLDEVVDHCWRDATRGCKTSGMPLQLFARKQILSNFLTRLDLMRKWLAATETKLEKASTGLLSLRKRILKEMDKALQEISAASECRNCTILGCMIKRLKNKLIGLLPDDRYAFADILRTGIFSLDESGFPLLDERFRKIRFYEPWRNALRHISAPLIGLRKMLEQISDDSYPECFDNLGTAIMICNYLEILRVEGYTSSHYAQDIIQAKNSAEISRNNFQNELELAFAYGRIQEETKEDLLEDILAFQDEFFDLNDFGCWRSFLDAMRNRIEEETFARGQELQTEIQERLSDKVDDKLSKLLSKAKEKLQPPERNFVVAEEYINRFDSGKSGDLEQAYIEQPEGSAFNRFISTNNFDRLFELCRRNKDRAIKNFGIDYIKKNLNMSAKYHDSSERLVRNWPNRPEEANIDRIKVLFGELGFAVDKVVKGISSGSYNRYAVHVKPDQKDKAEYNHPVAPFGTQMKPPIEVVCLYGQLQANDVVDNVCGLELNNTAIVLLNGAMDLAARRQMAERFHSKKSGKNPFLLIDWTLLLFLAMHQQTERLPVLLNCTLPYTSSYQPFVLSGSTPDEMFIGRRRELNSIIDPNGAVIVYGGRQLGKTALLERARSLQHRPGRKEFAVYVNADDCDCEADLAGKICDELAKSGVCVDKVDSLDKLCSILDRMFYAGKIVALLLLIDESDKFLGNFKDNEYKALRPLVSLRRKTTNTFKFVLAGLHNVCRVKEAFGPNSIFGQMGEPLCIRPLSSVDALQLLARPLRYLGFNVDDNFHLELILANANYYPGILHFVGYKLVENLTGRYIRYYHAVDGNPPFELQDDQLGAIMNSDDLNRNIIEKIRLTLRIDQRYFMLARCIAWYYYDDPESNRQGYSVENIKLAAECLEIKCLRDVNPREYDVLLQELVDMGILTKPSPVTFRLRQRKFLEAIGRSQAAVEIDIKSSPDNLSEEVNACG
jgi:hypothetical protein